MKRAIHHIVSLLLLLGTATYAQQQAKLGVPPIHNYIPQDYGHIGKVWGIESAPNGLLYFSTDFGLVEYDGEVWSKFKGSKGFTRSLMIVNDSMIYTGSDRDFGVWHRNDLFGFDYQSLYPFKEESSDISEEFWKIHHYKEAIVFVSSQNIYIYKEGQLTKIQAPARVASSFDMDDTIYFALDNGEIVLLDNYNLTALAGFPVNKDLQIKGIFKTKDGIGLVTQKSGLYSFSNGKLAPISSPLSSILKTSNVFSFARSASNDLAFGTVQKGAILTDLEGNIKHQINKLKGLPNNTILSMHWATTGRLWLGLDYGISAVEPNSDITYFYDYLGDFGTGSTAMMKDGIFYLGTNQGLFKSPISSLFNSKESFRFELVKGSEGQVWALKEISGQMLVGHDQGMFTNEKDYFTKISNIPGIWTFLRYGDYLLAGTYNGIYIYKKDNGSYKLHAKMNDFLGSCDQLLSGDDGTLWVNIPNFGIVKAELDDNLQPLQRKNFLIETFAGDSPRLSNVDNQMLVITDKARYRYDPENESFARLKSEYAALHLPGLLPGVYQPSPLSDSMRFYPIYNGFAVQQLTNGATNIAHANKIIFREVKAYNNDTSIIVSRNQEISSSLNNISIKWTMPFVDNVMYQYSLDSDGQWSTWSRENHVNLVNVRGGQSVLSVRAMINDHITEPAQITFQIARPWYRSPAAYAIYFLLAIALITLLNHWKRHLLKQQRSLMIAQEQVALNKQSQKYEKEIMLLEKENLLQQNDDLKHKLKGKTIELAAKAKISDEKVKLISDLNEKFQDLKKNPSFINVKWREIQTLLNSSLDERDKIFEVQMDELHQEYFQKLKTSFPKLSRNDLRMCAYIKIGLETKEISELLNIQPSSAYISRSRLRKKLNLEADEDLYEFLNTI